MNDLYRGAIEAVARDVYLPDYNRLLIVFPKLKRCGYAGLADSVTTSLESPDGQPITYSVAWINGADNLGAAIQEFGHSLGLPHTSGLRCKSRIWQDRPYLPWNVFDESCASEEYGDLFSSMGSGAGHFPPAQKVSLGWIPEQDVITLGPEPGTHTRVVHPLELPGANLLRIQKQIQSPSGGRLWYTVDNREAIGFDSSYGNSTVYPHATSGALIRLSSNYAAGLLLDMHPGTPRPLAEFTEAALALGETFTDGARLRITPKRNIGRDLEVEVNIPSQGVAPLPEFIDLRGGHTLYGVSSLRAQVWDDRDLIDRLRFFKDDQLLGEVTIADLTRDVPGQGLSEFRLSWDTRNEVNGSRHTLTVKARDSAGLEGVASVEVLVDNSGPRPTIVSPRPNEVVRGVVTVNVEVQIPDYLGRLQSVGLLANGLYVGQDFVAPYTFQWDTTYQIHGKPFVPDGVYTLSAVASSWDGRVHGTSAPVPVIVDNVPDGYGDFDGDGVLELRDAIEVLRRVVGREVLPSPMDPLFRVMDVNCDTRITLVDFIAILMAVVGRSVLPVGACRG